MKLARPVLAAAALAAAAAAVPANAATLAACTARLANAAGGTSTYCDTAAPGPTTSSGGWVRTVTVTVASGAVTGLLDCTLSWPRTFAATPTQPATFQMWDTTFCRLTMTASADGTSAVATSTTQYRISPR